MMALMTMDRIDAAEVRCARLAIGLREYELEDLLGVDRGTVAAWEERRRPVDAAVAELLADLTTAAAGETVRLIEDASTTGVIRTFLDDADVVSATEGRLALAGVHRVCAGRAATVVPDARVVRIDDDGVEHSTWMACVCAAFGVGQAQMQKWFNVPRRATQYWLNGTRPVPPGIAAELRVITDAARAHVDELAAGVDSDDPIVWVCATEDQMERQWPQHAQLPLVTHQVCAARAAATVDGARLVYLPG
ncbi:helix-turn-helix domain-containing protein [Gordonia sp. NPDC058843]|uniref:helix-turn-helix domain-containing protein n=1 Tax=Gordonia sp. NPDC058843 TaxID=3346648 RepID=UPI0036AA23BF